MRKLFVFLLLSLHFFAEGQVVVKGKITDTLNKKTLDLAVVTLVKKSDSTLFSFKRTAKDGSFQFSSVPAGKYLLTVSYPKFADYADEVEVANEEKDLGQIPLILKSALLEEVMVKQNIAIRMKGDTIEYKADSFKVAEGAPVKDLLKKLPGLQVDKNGQITAQGQKVEKVLVDGEEFFSDDPAVVIENLRADAIDKVQSYDKKSDQAEFTGVDDGSKSKTLNLVLKEDKKKGFLGKITIGGGTTERYSEEAMLNYFKGKKKISVYGIAGNTGKTGLGWEDRNNFGTGNDFGDGDVEMGAGYISITNSTYDEDFSDWSNRYSGEGIPESVKTGAHFSNKWGGDKQNANVNYSMKNVKVNGNGNSITKYILPDSAYYSKENHNQYTNGTEHLGSAKYDVKLDSLSSLQFKIDAKKQNNNFSINTNSETDDENFEVVNTNNRKTYGSTEKSIYLINGLWRQKFKKQRRTFSLSGAYKMSDEDGNGYLKSRTDFYNTNGNIFRTDTIDQYKSTKSSVQTLNSKIVYTEPISKKAILEFNYAFSDMNSESNKKSFDALNGKYELLNNLYSNHYSLHYQSNSGGIRYQYTGKKLMANFGTNIGAAGFRQKDSTGKEVRHLSFTSFMPNARIRYKFSSQKSFGFNYTGSPKAPTIEQVQPVLENTNPLFITIGNPSLKQAFHHTFSLNFNEYKMLSGKNIWLSGSFSPTQNDIVTNQEVVNGITKQQYVNTSGNYNYNVYSSIGTKLKKLDMNISFDLSTNGGRYVNFVNGVKNVTNNRSFNVNTYFGKYKEDKYDFSIRPGVSYNHSESGSSNTKNNFWSQDHNADFTYYVTKRFNFGSDINFLIRQKTDAFALNNSVTTWNARASYKVFKKKNGEFRCEIFDILKQKRGYDRSIDANYQVEKNYNTLSRYGMLSFIWNFSKNPGTTK